METTTEKYIGVKEALRVADELVESLSKENEELRRIVEGPKAERASVYQDIMTAVDKKIEEWKVATPKVAISSNYSLFLLFRHY